MPRKKTNEINALAWCEGVGLSVFPDSLRQPYEDPSGFSD